MNGKCISEAKDPYLRSSLTALRRASALARKVAIQTDTGIVVVVDGKIVEINADVLREQAKHEGVSKK